MTTTITKTTRTTIDDDDDDDDDDDGGNGRYKDVGDGRDNDDCSRNADGAWIVVDDDECCCTGHQLPQRQAHFAMLDCHIVYDKVITIYSAASPDGPN